MFFWSGGSSRKAFEIRLQATHGATGSSAGGVVHESSLGLDGCEGAELVSRVFVAFEFVFFSRPVLCMENSVFAISSEAQYP